MTSITPERELVHYNEREQSSATISVIIISVIAINNNGGNIRAT